ncbi:MAG: ATP-binding protein, partial [Cyclobacteriaceae bacterium]|nr:ATP-binding protein [Cyclobacteriaceae bacterium]
MLKIAIVGPESTGKTVLAEMLAQHYHTEWVPEYARDYLNMINRPYTKDDLEIMAIEQINLENRLEKKANSLLISDTTLLVIKIWCEFRYGECPEWIREEVQHRFYNLHLLTAIDIPWEEDPQREHPHKREYFYELYRRELERLGFDFIEIRGTPAERLKKSIEKINNL